MNDTVLLELTASDVRLGRSFHESLIANLSPSIQYIQVTSVRGPIRDSRIGYLGLRVSLKWSC